MKRSEVFFEYDNIPIKSSLVILHGLIWILFEIGIAFFVFAACYIASIILFTAQFILAWGTAARLVLFGLRRIR